VGPRPDKLLVRITCDWKKNYENAKGARQKHILCNDPLIRPRETKKKTEKEKRRKGSLVDFQLFLPAAPQGKSTAFLWRRRQGTLKRDGRKRCLGAHETWAHISMFLQVTLRASRKGTKGAIQK